MVMYKIKDEAFRCWRETDREMRRERENGGEKLELELLFCRHKNVMMTNEL